MARFHLAAEMGEISPQIDVPGAAGSAAAAAAIGAAAALRAAAVGFAAAAVLRLFGCRCGLHQVLEANLQIELALNGISERCDTGIGPDKLHDRASAVKEDFDIYYLQRQSQAGAMRLARGKDVLGERAPLGSLRLVLRGEATDDLAGRERADEPRLSQRRRAADLAELQAARRTENDAVAALQGERFLDREAAQAAARAEADQVLVADDGSRRGSQRFTPRDHVMPKVSRMI